MASKLRRYVPCASVGARGLSSNGADRATAVEWQVTGAARLRATLSQSTDDTLRMSCNGLLFFVFFVVSAPFGLLVSLS